MAILLAEITGSGLNLGDNNFTGVSQGIQTGYDTAPQKGVAGTAFINLNVALLSSDTVVLRIANQSGYYQITNLTAHGDGDTQLFFDPFLITNAAIPPGSGNKLQAIINGVTYETLSNITVIAKAGYGSVTIASPRNDSNSVQVVDGNNQSTTLADGDVIEYKLKTNGNYDVTMNADGTYSVNYAGAVGTVPQQTFEARVLSVESGVWVAGAWTTQTINEAGAPAKVNNVVVNPAASSLNVSWDVVAGILTKYTVEWKLSSAGTWTVQDVLPNVTTYQISSLSITQYDVRVVAVNSVGPGTYSDVSQATPISNAVPSQVTGLQLTAAINSINYSFTAVTSNPAVNGYTVEYKTSAGNTWTQIQLSNNVTSGSITGLTPGTAYDVRVFASNSNGPGAVSSTSSAAPISSGVQGYIVSVGNGGNWARGQSFIVTTSNINLDLVDEIVLFNEMFEYKCVFAVVGQNSIAVTSPLAMPNGGYGLKIRNVAP